MGLEAIHKTQEEIPEQYRELYSERNGQFELTGIAGVKTQADVDRLSVALTKEREDHKGTKAKFQVWGEMDYKETLEKLDSIPELQAAAKEGGIDEEKMSELVEARLKTRLAPVERDLATATTSLGEITTERDGLLGKQRIRLIHDNVRTSLVESKVLETAQQDALFLAERIFEIREDDGAIVTKDSVGVTPGILAKDWLAEMQPKRPHWWAPSKGGGAGGTGTGGVGADNPWTKDNWNLTKQGQFAKEFGIEKATAAAKSVGSSLGATHAPLK